MTITLIPINDIIESQSEESIEPLYFLVRF
jgi:hypothetical protein